jgi:outer membrane protein TolC
MTSRVVIWSIVYMLKKRESISMKILALLFIISFSTHAAPFDRLFQDFKQYRKALKAQYFELQKASVQFDLTRYMNQPYLSMSYVHDDRFLDALFSFQARKTISTTSELALTKAFDPGLSLTFAHRMVNYDLSNWTQAERGTLTSEVYEHLNSVALEVDLLKNLAGYKRYREIEAASFVHKASKNQIQDKVFTEYLNFFNAYVDTKIKYSDYQLQRAFKKKSQETYRLIKKRVKDGLSKKADLYQAELSFFEQDQKEKSAFVNFENQKRTMSEFWGESRNINFISAYKIKNYAQLKSKFDVINNLNLQSLDYLAQQQNLLKKIKNRDQLPDLKLNVEYIANAFNEDSAEAFQTAVNERTRKETKVSLNLTWGLGSVDAKNSKQQDLSNRISELDYQAQLETIRNIKKNNEALYDDLYVSLKSRRKQIQIADRIVVEHRKMYLRGQLSLDQLIRSEEQSLNQKRQYYQLFGNFLKNEANLYYLAGELNQYFKKYTNNYEKNN